MSVVAHHVLLALAVVALLDAGLRAAAACTSGVVERAIAGVVLAASAAVVEALGLGLVRLGTDPAALSVAAAATWLAARRWLPLPLVPLGRGISRWWRGLSASRRFAAGSVVGAGVAWTAFLVRFPGFGWDGLTYHLPEVVKWVQHGTPGSIETVVPGWPVGNYPLANEVLLAWAAGIARSYVPVALWPSAMLALLAAGAWVGLRALRVPTAPAALAVGALCTLPVLTSFQLNGPNTDLPALAWLVSAAALCAVAVRRDEPLTLVPALLAAGLAAGTKTTVLALVVLAVVIALVAMRGRLRRFAIPLGLAAAGALVVGGTWYVRNLIDHGSPLWPFLRAPWGDPAPHAVARIDNSFIQRPLATLRRFGGDHYLGTLFAGGTLLLGGALIAPLVARARPVLAASAVTAASLLLWAAAPATGVTDLRGADIATVANLRYVLPAAGMAILTLALAARAGRRTRIAATAALAAGLGLNLWQLFDLGYPAVPSLRTPLLGALAGGLAAALIASRLSSPWLWRPLALAGAAVAAGIALGAAAPGLVDRNAKVPIKPASDGPLIRVFAGPAADGRPIAMAPYTFALLSGPKLRREVDAIPRLEPCDRIRARARRGWVVVAPSTADDLFGPTSISGCVRGWRPMFDTAGYRVYGDGSPPRGS